MTSAGGMDAPWKKCTKAGGWRSRACAPSLKGGQIGFRLHPTPVTHLLIRATLRIHQDILINKHFKITMFIDKLMLSTYIQGD